MRRAASRALQAPIVVTSKVMDDQLRQLLKLFPHAKQIDSFAELQAYLEALPSSPGPRTLDLVDHRDQGSAIMSFGSWRIDATAKNPSEELEGLVRTGVLRQLGITEVRLLGCATACAPAALETIQYLAQILRVTIVATRWQIHPTTDFTSDGFNDEKSGDALIDSVELEQAGWQIPLGCQNPLDDGRLAPAPAP